MLSTQDRCFIIDDERIAPHKPVVRSMHTAYAPSMPHRAQPGASTASHPNDPPVGPVTTPRRAAVGRGQLRVAAALGALLAGLLAACSSGRSGSEAQTTEAQTAEAQTAEAQTADARARAIATHSLSPFCPGMTLESCPSPNAATLRAEIRQWAREGVSPNDIRARLNARFPDFDFEGHQDPYLPLVAMALATVLLGGLAYGLFRRKAPPASDASEAPKAPAPDDADPVGNERLDAELAALDDD